MLSKLIVVLVCLIGAALGGSSPSPVFLSDNSIPKPAFYTTFPEEFSKILEPIARDTMFVAFLEPKLQTSDFSCSTPSTHESCFRNLKTVPQKTFYANVVNPIEALRDVSSKVEYVNVDTDGKLDQEVVCEPGASVIIDLSHVGKAATNEVPRHELLENHDEIMSKVTKKLSENCKVTAIYTRAQSPTDVIKNRSRRAAITVEGNKGVFFRSGGDFLLYFTKLSLKDVASKETSDIRINDMALTDKNDTAFTVNLSGGSDKLTFLVSLDNGYFKVSDLKLNNEKFHVPPEMTSPTDFSYACGNQSFFTVDLGKFIYWDSLQMQAPFNNATKPDFDFSEPWYCVGFFSPGILAGLFCVFILLAIVSVGICWMLDINTMDRFDDPKGKTITINVNE